MKMSHAQTSMKTETSTQAYRISFAKKAKFSLAPVFHVKPKSAMPSITIVMEWWMKGCTRANRNVGQETPCALKGSLWLAMPPYPHQKFVTALITTVMPLQTKIFYKPVKPFVSRESNFALRVRGQGVPPNRPCPKNVMAWTMTVTA